MEKKVLNSIRKISKGIKRYFCDGQDLEKKINYTQLQIVAYLFKHEDEEVCQKDLQEATHLNKASIAATIDSLEDKGVVERIQSKVDKRRNIIVLTENAKKKHHEFEKKMNKLEEELLSGIEEKDLESFYIVIDKINENLERKNK